MKRKYLLAGAFQIALLLLMATLTVRIDGSIRSDSLPFLATLAFLGIASVPKWALRDFVKLSGSAYRLRILDLVDFITYGSLIAGTVLFQAYRPDLPLGTMLSSLIAAWLVIGVLPFVPFLYRAIAREG